MRLVMILLMIIGGCTVYNTAKREYKEFKQGVITGYTKAKRGH